MKFLNVQKEGIDLSNKEKNIKNLLGSDKYENVYCFMIYHIYSYTYMVVYTFTGSHRFYKADDIAKY